MSRRSPVTRYDAQLRGGRRLTMGPARQYSESPVLPAVAAITATLAEEPEVAVAQYPTAFGWATAGSSTTATSPSAPVSIPMRSNSPALPTNLAGMNLLAMVWARRYSTFTWPAGFTPIAGQVLIGCSWEVAECRDYDGATPLTVTAGAVLASTGGYGWGGATCRMLVTAGGVGGWRVVSALSHQGGTSTPQKMYTVDPGGGFRFQAVLGQSFGGTLTPAPPAGTWPAQVAGNTTAQYMNPPAESGWFTDPADLAARFTDHTMTSATYDFPPADTQNWQPNSNVALALRWES